MCVFVSNHGRWARILLSSPNARSFCGAPSSPFSHLGSPPTCRKSFTCRLTRYEHWCLAAAWKRAKTRACLTDKNTSSFLTSITSFLELQDTECHLRHLPTNLPLCQCSACNGGTRVRPSEAGNAESSGSSPGNEDGSPSLGRCYPAGRAKRRPRISTAFWRPLCWLEGSRNNNKKNATCVMLVWELTLSKTFDSFIKSSVTSVEGFEPLSLGWICLVRFPVAWGSALPYPAQKWTERRKEKEAGWLWCDRRGPARTWKGTMDLSPPVNLNPE